MVTVLIYTKKIGIKFNILTLLAQRLAGSAGGISLLKEIIGRACIGLFIACAHRANRCTGRSMNLFVLSVKNIGCSACGAA